MGQLMSQTVYPDAKQRALKIRVDDDVAVYQGENTVINSHTIPGWQWTTVYDANINTNLLVLTAWNQVMYSDVSRVPNLLYINSLFLHYTV